MMARAQQRQGNAGEQAAEIQLRSLGVYNLAKIPVDKVITKSGHTIYKERVLGDRRGELENGISVLCEVKTTKKDRLTWSAFTSEHQPQALDDHRGVSLLVWVYDNGYSYEVYFLRWQMLKEYGFAKGYGIGLSEASEIDKLTVNYIRNAEKVRVL
jgi:hypothetical protein